MTRLRSFALVVAIVAVALGAGAEPLPPCPPQPAGSVYKPVEKPAVVDAGAPASAPTPPASFKKKGFKPPPKPPPAPAVECGGRKNPCPLQAWMRLNMSRALASDDAGQLTAALTKLATTSPVPSWRWNEIANDGVFSAKKGDFEGAREACRKCHELYKAPYKDKHRTRAAPP